MSTLRRFLYALARLLGDLSSVRRGPGAVGRRAGRRIAGRWLSRLLKALFD